MRLYFRADSRSPDEIFAHGFKPRVDTSKFAIEKPWWMFGLRCHSWLGYQTAEENDFTGYEYSYKQPMDADINHVVSITTEFTTAPIFPINQDNEVNVYVIALPQAVLPTQFHDENQDEIDVFDLHALQISQGQKIIDANPEENPGYIAQAFCGYEAFIRKIEPSAIIGMIKCKHSDLVCDMSGARVFPSIHNSGLSFDRWFQVQDEFLCNLKFVGDRTLKNCALDKIRSVKAKGIQPTSNVVDALQASGIRYNKEKLTTTTVFWDELIHLNFLNAASSIIVSIRYFFKLLYNFITNQHLFKPNDQQLTVHEKEPESANTTPKGLLPKLGLLSAQEPDEYDPIETPKTSLC